MIRIRILGEKELVTSIRVTGHALFAKHGQDIVCAGVSALIQNLILGLKPLTSIHSAIDKKHGCVILEIKYDGATKEEMDKFNFLVETTLLSLEEISREHRAHVDVTYTNKEK